MSKAALRYRQNLSKAKTKIQIAYCLDDCSFFLHGSKTFYVQLLDHHTITELKLFRSLYLSRLNCIIDEQPKGVSKRQEETKTIK